MSLSDTPKQVPFHAWWRVIQPMVQRLVGPRMPFQWADQGRCARLMMVALTASLTAYPTPPAAP